MTKKVEENKEGRLVQNRSKEDDWGLQVPYYCKLTAPEAFKFPKGKNY